MLIIDGITWPVTPKIKRRATLKASEISKLMLDKNFLNDVIGVYLSYEITVGIPFWNIGRYTNLYETLTDPVDGHSMILPYNQGNITITGRIEVVEDEYVRRPNGGNYWRDTTFVITANHPTKTVTLGEAITRGLAPIPDIGGVQVGDIYEYTANGWVKYTPPSYQNADNMYF